MHTLQNRGWASATEFLWMVCLCTLIALALSMPATAKPRQLTAALDTPSSADWHLQQGNRHFQLGRFQSAVSAWTVALKDFETAGERVRWITTLGRRAEAYQALGHFRNAIEDLSRALEAAKPMNNSGLVANLQGNLGNVYFMSGALVQAQAELLASLKYASANQDLALVARAQNNLGNVQYAMGRLSEAEQAFGVAHDQARRALEPDLAATALLNQSRVMFDLGGIEEAEGLARRAGDGFRGLDDSHRKAMGLVSLGRLLRRLNLYGTTRQAERISAAYHSLQEANRVATAIGDDRAASYALGSLGRLYEDQKRTRRST